MFTCNCACPPLGRRRWRSFLYENTALRFRVQVLKGAISGGDKGRNKEQFHQYALANVRVQQKYDHLRLAKTELGDVPAAYIC